MPNELGCIAVVDDDPIMGESLQRALELEGWRAVWWHTGKRAVDEMCALCPDLVLCDIRLPDMSGEEVFRAANARSLAPPFIFMTAYGQIDQAVALVRAGAQDYLTKPFELASLFQKAREILSLRVRDGAQGALGVSPSMRRVEALLRRLAPRSLSILFTGETGAGKEVCARFLHQVSPAAAEPFMAVNCAAIPAELLESEVFGHERGAFSGAHQRHLGYAERARGGILFLDEIAAMPLALQSKLLRVLEERSFHRVGGEANIPLKARIVCATSENLAEQVRRGTFREDLLYRINAVTVDLPPLRDRPEDIPWLLSRYFALFAEQAEVSLRGISSLAEEAALSHPWRGNVRELAQPGRTGGEPRHRPVADAGRSLSRTPEYADRRGRSDPSARRGARRSRKAANRARASRDRRADRRGGEAARNFAHHSVGEDAPLSHRGRERWRVMTGAVVFGFPNLLRRACSESRTRLDRALAGLPIDSTGLVAGPPRGAALAIALSIVRSSNGETHEQVRSQSRYRPSLVPIRRRRRRGRRSRRDRRSAKGGSQPAARAAQLSREPPRERQRPQAQRRLASRLSRRRRAGRPAEARQPRSPAASVPTATSSASRTICPHKGFPLAYNATDKTLNCSGHYSRFDCENGGQEIWGHATQNLPQYLLRVDAKGDIYAEGIDELLYGRLSNVLEG